MSGTKRADYAIELDDGLDEYDKAEVKAVHKMDKLGLLGPQEAPRWDNGERFDGRIPHNLSTLSGREIGEYYNLMDGFTNFVAWQRVLAETALLSAKEKLDLTEAAVRKTKAGTAQQKRDSTIVDHRYVQANAEWIEAKAYFELLRNIEEAARRDMKTVSRLVEVKKMELEGGRRGENLGRTAPQAFQRPSRPDGGTSPRRRKKGGFK
jgi:hypothetical protein